jgi:hypothetical protein
MKDRRYGHLHAKNKYCWHEWDVISFDSTKTYLSRENTQQASVITVKTKRCATRPSPLPTIFRRERSNESSGLASHPISQRTTVYERSGKQRSDHLS